jgi:hypothetical protein
MSLIAFWYLVTCRCCGRDYLNKRPDKKTCSGKCRQELSRFMRSYERRHWQGKCKPDYNRPARAAGYGHHDDVLFQLRTGQIKARDVNQLA